MTHVPYRTMNSAVGDLAVGRLDSDFPPLGDARPCWKRSAPSPSAAAAAIPNCRRWARCRSVIADPVFVEKAMAIGMEPRGGTPEQLEKFIRAEAERWLPVLQSLNLPKQG